MKNIINKFSDWIVYQIYPRSFCDSNNDGIGDLKGITSKLDYLKDLGVNAVWLSPCYKSPNDDNGYDISDYRDIMDEFGTLDDFKKMLFEMHKREIRLIMDLVPNHSSTSHEWFKKSRQRIEPYTDYYYWFDEPPNNWQSCFGGSAWQYDEVRKQYYLRSFAVSQADLNFDNPLVRQEIKDIIDYWVDLGIDGFRIDVIDMISKEMDKENCFGPNLHKYINEMFGRDKVDFLFTVGECGASTLEQIKEHIDPNRKELKTLFQFEHCGQDNDGRFKPKPFKISDVFGVISKWEKLYQENNLLYTLFLENHDQVRSISRYGNDKELRYECATCFATALYLMKGVPFIYQGQELGVRNQNCNSFDDFNDVENIEFIKNNLPKLGEEKVFELLNNWSRDNARRPMPWNNSINGGFSIVKPWITPNQDIKEINVELDKSSEKSIFNFYKKLLEFRKNTEAILTGVYTEIECKNALIYTRENEFEKYLIICNFESETNIKTDYYDGEIVICNYKKTLSNINRIYKPFECAVYKIK